MRGIEHLHPKARAKAEQLMTLCLQKGLPLRITETFRTVAEQDTLYAQGRTAPGNIVTNCKGSSYQSGHQWGVAFDFCRNVKGREWDDSDGFYGTIGALGKSIGLAWGGDWKSPDKPHFELPEYMPSNSTTMLKAKYGMPERFKETWPTEELAQRLAEPVLSKHDSVINIRVMISKTAKIRVMDIEEYLRGVVPAEMYAYWEPEALKAQAVAARSYALINIKRNFAKNYDVDDTTAYQAYNPSKICPATDAAVSATRGQVLTFNGAVAETVYSASNGGKALSAESVWGGAVPYLPGHDDPFDKKEKYGHGVGMSQEGAQAAALAGYGYKEILAFYYPGTALTANNASLPLTEQAAALKTDNEITVDNAIAAGVLMDRELWLKILSGEMPAEPERIKTAFDRYHIRLTGKGA